MKKILLVLLFLLAYNIGAEPKIKVFITDSGTTNTDIAKGWETKMISIEKRYSDWVKTIKDFKFISASTTAQSVDSKYNQVFILTIFYEGEEIGK